MDELSVFTSSGPASHDLAFEAEMLERAADGRSSLLATSWTGPVVVLGYAQPPGDADLDWCRDSKIPVLRRLTGGTGVIHRRDLSLSLALPQAHPWAASIVGLYGRFLGVLQPALSALGSPVECIAEPEHGTRVRSPVCFFDQLADTLVIDGRKAVGCSQTRKKGGVLIHAAILLSLEPELYGRVFGVSADDVERQLTPALEGTDHRRIAEALAREFGRALGFESCWYDRPKPGSGSLAPYGLDRWAPVPDDGIL